MELPAVNAPMRSIFTVKAGHARLLAAKRAGLRRAMIAACWLTG